MPTYRPSRLFILVLSGALLLVHPIPASSETPAKSRPDTEQRRLIIGTWEDHYQGKRTMTVRADGTATMIVELSGAKAVLYASRLRFDMVWSLDQGRLRKRTVGGEPSGRVKLILNLMGNQVNESILELTDERLVLLDENGRTRYEWKRVRVSPEKARP
jgi:hypothetical protein